MASDREVQDIIMAAQAAENGVRVWTNNPSSARSRLSVVKKKMKEKGADPGEFRVAIMGENELWIVKPEAFNEYG